VKDGKQAIREWVWRLLEERGAARFPGARGRIPNFSGAETAAARLGEVAAWREARAIKANPDAPQLPVRARALREGKTVVMAVPRLREEACFLLLDPHRLRVSPRNAASIRGAFLHGRAVRPEEVPPIDLVALGSVAVSRDGARLGKGGGYADLEYALGREFGFVSQATATLTTVHHLQIVAERIPMTDHDVPVDWIVTPEGVVETRTSFPRPKGILDAALDAEKRAAIPVLARRWG
jgi:5-formyltetrahydrofolate cyclo-ligase